MHGTMEMLSKTITRSGLALRKTGKTRKRLRGTEALCETQMAARRERSHLDSSMWDRGPQ